MSSTTSSGPSDRVRVAEAARDAALATPGVVGLDSGPVGTFATVGGGERVAGVTSAAAPGRGFDITLRVVCEFVPLPALAERVRASVLRQGEALGIEIETVQVDVVDIADPTSDA